MTEKVDRRDDYGSQTTALDITHCRARKDAKCGFAGYYAWHLHRAACTLRASKYTVAKSTEAEVLSIARNKPYKCLDLTGTGVRY